MSAGDLVITSASLVATIPAWQSTDTLSLKVLLVSAAGNPEVGEPVALADVEAATLADAPHKSTILSDRSFWGLLVTQFLGAFNDNLYKQLMLLMAISAVGGKLSEDTQGWAAALFSLPFVLLSSFAGYLSDKFSKSRIIFICKVAEIVITLLAVAAFLAYGRLGDWGTWSVLLLMGIHSTFFGPAKYGILPELFAKRELPRANGLILMSTFLAIILGVVAAGFFEGCSDDQGSGWIGELSKPLDWFASLRWHRSDGNADIVLDSSNQSGSAYGSNLLG